ncbi:MAG: hypothetical protein KC912_05525 [Proteobacteria bacterium]|nr:hypothetical protein [Pseudomonadota bacterium]
MFLALLLLTAAPASELTDLLSAELDNALEVFSAQDEKPHYLALAVTDQDQVTVSARGGTVGSSIERHERVLDVDLRVGEPALDSTHPLRGFSAMEGSSRSRVLLPAESGYALRHAIRTELDGQYRDHAERIVMIRANRSVKVEEEDNAPDFSPRDESTVDELPIADMDIDREAWEVALSGISAILEESEHVHASNVQIQAVRTAKSFVDSEGSSIVHGTVRARVSMQVQSVADDGDHINVFVSKDVHDPSALPTEDVLTSWATEAVDHLHALRDAPRATPYSGPVLLTGKASGVFFHEVFGHRVEGHRQKRESEGKTFADYVGKPILPDFIDVFDDPTIAHLAGDDLNGHYAYDDEGVPATRAELVDDGVFQGFLMSRTPISGFPDSNGHGRRMAGRAPVARMGNTIVEAAKTSTREQLRTRLRKYAKDQDLDFGILVEDIEGGFTLTGRVMPNAFNVRASTAWRVFVDGREDELIRGIDLVGTPFVAFSNLRAAGEERQVFNGHCGAESGWVPVSAVAPDLLFERLEFQLKEKGQERPPLLDKPGPDGSSDAEGVAQ